MRVKLLDKLEKAWRYCQDCELGERRHKIVYWRGSPKAKLAVIGEGPGRDEDEQGLPFVGAAGKKLDELLREAGVDAVEEVFITNMVGCRPPNNRQPRPDEIAACRERLEAMLWAVDPKALLLLGGTAAKLAGIQQITKWRGEIVEVEMCLMGKRIVNFDAVATFHPSYLMRNGDNAEMKAQIVGDIKLAYRIAHGKD